MTTKVELAKENGDKVELIFGIYSYRRFCELMKDVKRTYEEPIGFDEETGKPISNPLDLILMNSDFIISIIISGIENERIYKNDHTKLSVVEAEILIDELGGTESPEIIKMLESFKFLNSLGEKQAETTPQKKTSVGKKSKSSQ